MKITHIRVGKLVTTGGYNNKKVELEAEVAEGEDPAVVYGDLTVAVDALLENRAIQSIREEVESLEWQVGNLRGTKTRLELEVESLKRQRTEIKGTSERPEAPPLVETL